MRFKEIMNTHHYIRRYGRYIYRLSFSLINVFLYALRNDVVTSMGNINVVVPIELVDSDGFSNTMCS